RGAALPSPARPAGRTARPGRRADRSPPPRRALRPRLQPNRATELASRASLFIGRSSDIVAHVPRRSQADVERSRAAVTQAALQRGSIEGLEGLSLGALADEAEMRKSTVFSLFGSKEELQLATLRAAADHFRQEVWDPVADEPAGRA